MNPSEIADLLADDLRDRYLRLCRRYSPEQAAVAVVCGEDCVRAAIQHEHLWYTHLFPAEGRRICRLLGLPIT